MRHINPNAIAPALEGIERGELALEDPNGDKLLAEAYATIERLTAPVEPSGFRLGRTQTAKEIARAQGFIAAYRAGTEFEHICECGGTIYATGSQCRETGVWETRCTGCDHHDY